MIPLSLSTLLGVLFFVIGLSFGSFGSMLVVRVPERRSIRGRSMCQRCDRVLGVLDLLPLVSFLFLRGRCRGCSQHISWRYPLIEFMSGIIFVFALWRETSLLSAVLLALALWLLFLISVVDAQYSMIPDALNIPFVVVSILYALSIAALPLTAILLGTGFFGVQWILSHGRWVGSGDVLLGAGIGALVSSWSLVVVFLFASYILGALLAAGLLVLHRKTMADALAFAPFLAMGTFFTLIFGQTVLMMLRF